MTIAIRTKYLSPTNNRGSRISATLMVNAATRKALSVGKSTITVGYYEFDGDPFAKHAQVAKTLAERLKWAGSWVAGDDGAGGWVYVNAGRALLPGAAFVVTDE